MAYNNQMFIPVVVYQSRPILITIFPIYEFVLHSETKFKSKILFAKALIGWNEYYTIQLVH